ncbi:MAG: hypothetical protein RJA78_1086 [Actinomycetota bacterium]
MTEETTEVVEETPATPLTASRLPYHLVENDAGLAAALEVITSTEEPLALDAERASGFRYGQRAYLIQVGVAGKTIYLIDPVAQYSDSLWSSLIEVLSNKPWIIHAASQDLPCLTELGIEPSKILDTELGSRILGLPRVSLGTITEHYLALKLAKEHSAVDWSERPLRKEWLEYAALDVDVLHELWDCVEADLVSNGKLAIATEEFEFLTLPQIKPVKVDRWRSMSGLHELKDARSLTIAKHLWEAREKLALDRDYAPGRLIPDAAIIAVVKALPKSKSELASLRTFTGKASRTFLDIWWDAYTQGSSSKDLVELRIKSSGIPNHRNWPQKFPEANARLLAAKAVIAELSTGMNVPPENILSPDTMRAICFEPPMDLTTESISDFLRSKQARNWQIEAVAEGFAVALATTVIVESPAG